MKSKQEIIQEAWVNTNIQINVWSDYSNTGWVKIKSEQWSSFYHLLDIIKWNDHTWSIRPKSLQGIENNNGWTRIESEADLPKEGMTNYMYCTDGKPSIHVVNLRLLINLFNDGMISHYMALPASEAPIY